MKSILAYAGAAAVVAVAGICGWLYLTWNPDALWQIVSERCVPKARQGAADNPCVKVDLNGEYAILKDRNGRAQYLLIPTRRIEGIESPELVEAGAHNYWRDAWNERGYVGQALRSKLAPEEIGLAVNSASGRSQEQLHIHIDCMTPGVVAVLRANRSAITERWSELPSPLSRHRYRALLITDATLADGKPGFILLDTHVGSGGNASAEELLDHSCGVANRNDAG